MRYYEINWDGCYTSIHLVNDDLYNAEDVSHFLKLTAARKSVDEYFASSIEALQIGRQYNRELTKAKVEADS